MCARAEEYVQIFGGKILKERDYCEELDIDGKVLLIWILHT